MPPVDIARLSDIVATAAFTIVGGLLILVMGQLIEKLIIEPRHNQSRIIAEIHVAIIFYSDIYANPGIAKPERMDQASDHLRKLAAELASNTRIIRPRWRTLSKEKAKRVKRNLIGLSNGLYQGGNPDTNLKWSLEIRRDLNLDTE